MKKAVIIIARNEGDWPYKASISFNKHFPDCDLIGIDDGGENKFPNYVRVFRTTGGIGVGNVRRMGVEMTDADLLLITDAHVFYEKGDIGKAWDLCEQGYIVNSTTLSYTDKRDCGNGRTHALPAHQCKNVKVKEGLEVGLIGGIYFMRKDVAKQVIAPTPSHGFNEQIMTCAAFSLGHRIYTYPDLCFSHVSKKKFNYKVAYSGQQRNRKLLDWWFFDGKKPTKISKVEQEYFNFIQSNRVLDKSELKSKILEMNFNLERDASNKRI